MGNGEIDLGATRLGPRNRGGPDLPTGREGEFGEELLPVHCKV